MKLSQFKFNLPSELIALQPTQNRDEARLMVVDRKTGKIEHRVFKDLVDYVRDGDVFVINNTKVFPAKLYGEKEKTGAKIEVLLLRELDHESRLWDVLVDPARKIRIGNKLYFGEGDELVAEVIDNTTSRGRTLRFLYDGTYDEFKKTLSGLGHTPIPKELNREERPEDAEDFQTIYAKVEGAVSAPTAGMHFSKILMKRLEIIGASFAELTLHPGMGNFRDIEVEDLTKHKPDSEEMYIDEECCTLVNEANAYDHRWQDQALQRLDKQVHLPALHFLRSQLHDHQLPPAQIAHDDGGGRIRWLRPADEGLQGSHCREVSFLHLW